MATWPQAQGIQFLMAGVYPFLFVVPFFSWACRSHAEENGWGEKCANDEGFDIYVFHNFNFFQGVFVFI